MNDKLCKRLRRKARDRTIGKPLSGYVGIKQIANSATQPFVIGAGNDPHTFRGVYREMKKALRHE